MVPGQACGWNDVDVPSWTGVRIMGRWWAVGVVAVAAAGVLAAGSAPARAAHGDVFRYNFNDGNLAPVTDITGNGHTGTVLPDVGAVQLITGPGGGGHAVQYPTTGTAVIEVGGAVFHPGSADFRYGAVVRLLPDQVTDGANVVQDGTFSTADQWKLQVDRGVASCVVKVDGGSQIVVKGGAVDDGKWHSLECRKTGTTLAIYVGGVLRASTTVPAGAIDDTGSAGPRIGAKGLSTNNDQFRGSLDQVFFAVVE